MLFHTMTPSRAENVDEGPVESALTPSMHCRKSDERAPSMIDLPYFFYPFLHDVSINPLRRR